MLTLTVVRHGESTGMNQAKALGESLKTTRIDAIFASDLLRALWTAQQIEGNQADPRPSLTVSPLLREQHFGKAEQQPFGEKGGYVRQPGRRFKFDEGENLDDVHERAHQAIAQFIEPLLRESRGRPAESKHIAVVAHGVFNSEFIGALLSRRPHSQHLSWSYRGMTNTGWTRLEVGYASETSRCPTPQFDTHPQGVTLSSLPGSPPPATFDEDCPPLLTRILATDVTTHLEGVHRQKGGIGSQGYDAKQKDLRSFFSGASTNSE
ncbi:hypothetical protein EHS25_006853 [Saitozyma podzolica]|uniref:Phosphoglycerate mutase n=1 Tax=Saitozyma podzolica TaxID=1890683 RepID=A0A427XRM3_9TREE|nr:hypothetical protein EHS25_006853 [Saitozyma podzolica]